MNDPRPAGAPAVDPERKPDTDDSDGTSGDSSDPLLPGVITPSDDKPPEGAS